MADLNPKDHTSEFDQNDIQQNKVMAVLAYIGILVLVPIFAAKESKFAKFHVNQGLVLAIVEIGASIILSILSNIPYIGFLFSILSGIVGIVCFVFSIMGIVYAAQGQAKELPLIGQFKLIK